MKNFKITLIAIITLTIINMPGLIYAQEIGSSSINAAGTEYSNEHAIVNWTIGQTAISTLSSDDAILTQGFQQYLYSVTEVPTDFTNDIQISAYPNPTDNFVFIEFSDDEYLGGTIEILDLNGKLIDIKEIYNTKTPIELSQYAPSLFLINIKQSNQILKTYKIIRNQ